METKKITQSGLFFKWAGIASLISAGLCLIGILVILIPLLFGYSLNNFFPEYFHYGIVSIILMLAGIFFAGVLDLIIGEKLIAYSKLNDSEIQNKILPLIIMAIITATITAFGVSAILIVVGFIMSLLNNNQKSSEQREKNDLTNKQDALENKLLELKKMKENGIITAEEHKELIKGLF